MNKCWFDGGWGKKGGISVILGVSLGGEHRCRLLGGGWVRGVGVG